MLLAWPISIFLALVQCQRDCGTPDPSPESVKELKLKLSDDEIIRFSDPFRYAVINVYFHTIVNSNGAGRISNDTIKSQMSLLNKSYNAGGIYFRLVEITESVNNDWFTLDLSNFAPHYAMKRALRKGGYDALNIYTADLKNLGYSTFPIDVQKDTVFDGVVVQYTALPRGSYQNYNLGMTVVHEVGHWVGLQHTFKGESCDGDGDGVDDTPQQKSATAGCPTVIPDTCPDKPGLDPIHNYMDYSIDRCMDNFTPGQFKLMTIMLRMYRGVQDGDGPIDSEFTNSDSVSILSTALIASSIILVVLFK